VNLDPVTRRYADALFELASDNGVLDAVVTDVERLARDVERPEVSGRLFDARVSQEERRAALESLLGGAQPLLARFARLVFDKRRESVLRGLGLAFHRRALAERGAVEGFVESPRPLSSEDIERLQSSLATRLGREVLLENRVSSDLLAGLRVVVDNKMVDYSAQGRLDALRRRMLDASLPSPA
jgi:F-type H+-transporting ATPase subunit delta